MERIVFRMTALFRNSLPLLLLGLATSVAGLDRPAFARSLEAEGDWYRAIGVWKELRFEAPTPDAEREATQSILLDLWKAGQYEAGLKELVLWEEDSPGKAAWSGLFQYKLNRFAAAEFAWTQGGSPVYLGLLMARTGREDEAARLWSGLPLPDPREQSQDRREPWIAATASFLLPGSGQFYSGHWFDGAQALGMVGFFGFAAYGTYLYDSQSSDHYGLTVGAAAIGLFFHAANVYGAWKTAEFYNQSRDALRYRGWERAVFQTGLPSL